MLVGWRMAEDLEVLAGLPDGTLTIDVLSGRATHTGTDSLHLHISEELQAWLTHRMAELKVPLNDLDEALVVARIRTDRIATDRKRIVSFDFECESSLRSGARLYHGSLTEKHVWHARAVE